MPDLWSIVKDDMEKYAKVQAELEKIRADMKLMNLALQVALTTLAEIKEKKK